jgi:tetratricopeptide (TPR) repeat protein
MESFLHGDVHRSLLEFDQALESDPNIGPYLWQRGLSLWLVGKYEDASIQFERDVKVNPNDVEEALWKFLSDAKLQGVGQARKNFLKVGGDARPIMKLCLKLYQDESETPQTIFSTRDLAGDDANSFYASLYTGLWYDAFGHHDKALEFLAQSLKTRYAAESGDYMIAVCKEAAKKISQEISEDVN